MTAEQTRAAALRLIKFRPRSEAELRRRLLQKGAAPADTEGLIQEFRQKGLLDDAKFARLFIAQRMHSRPVGRRMLTTQLKAQGVSAALVEQAVEQGTEGQDELETVRKMVRERFSRMGSLPRLTAERRLFGFLSRRGFSADVVYKVIRETVHSSTSSE